MKQKSKNLGTVRRFMLPGILIFAFCLLTFAFPNMALAQGSGKALDFDGDNDYVDCGNDASLNITDAITVEAWVKFSELSRTEGILSKGSYSLKIGSDGKAIFSLRDSNTTVTECATLPSALDTYSLAVFNSYLYSATAASGRLYRSSDGTNWTEVEHFSEGYLIALVVFKDQLYLATYPGAKIYRSSNGVDWYYVTDLSESGYPWDNVILTFAVFNEKLYAGTGWATNAKVYRSSDGSVWEEVGSFIDAEETVSLSVFNSYLYAGTGWTKPDAGIYRSSCGENWVKVYTTPEEDVGKFAVFKDYIYAGTIIDARIYRSSNGVDWVEVADLTIPEDRVDCLSVFNGKLYAGTRPNGEIYETSDGINWTLLIDTDDEDIHASVVFNGYLFWGTLASSPYYHCNIYRLGDGIDIYSNQSVEQNEWTQLAATYDGSTAKLYLNGNQVGSNSKSIAVDTNDLNLLIGNSYGSTQGGLTGSGEENFKGKIDEVRIWNVARTQTQIRENMCKKLTGSEDGLVSYWRFDEGSGMSAYDQTANDNEGTLTNMDTEDWIWSGAALGDESAYDYTGAVVGDFSATISHTDGDDITATGDGGTFTGIQVYRVDETSMRTDAAKPGADWNMDPLRYWGVFAVGTSPTYTVTYDYNGHPGITDESDLGLAVRDNHAYNSWADLDATLDTGANTLTKTGQSGTEYALGSKTGQNTLPVVLSLFTAQYLDEQAQLSWQTQTESDNMGWNVYRNSELDFTSAIRINDELIPGHGTTTQPHDYEYEDTNGQFESGDDYWYWLESVDYSGKVYHYDRVAIMHISEEPDPDPHVEIPGKYQLQSNPNPFNSNLTIGYMLRKSDMVRVEIYNIHGNLLAEFDEGQSTEDISYTLKWNGQDLSGKDVSSGVLLIKLITTEGYETKKAILIR